MPTNPAPKQVKSKERVQKHGEVFTPQWVVNDMLNLLPDEVWQPHKTFLEPACGEGAFLVEIYRRKLQQISTKEQNEWEWQSAIATSSLYGIELLEDNAKQCRDNLIQLFEEFYNKSYPYTQDRELIQTVQFLINRNIIRGNALTYRKCTVVCGNECSTCPLIIFSEWTPFSEAQFIRKDYTYQGVINADSHKKKYEGSLFEDLFSNEDYGFEKEYKPVYFKKIQYVEN